MPDSRSSPKPGPGFCRLEPSGWNGIGGFLEDDHAAALETLQRSSDANPVLRPGVPAPDALRRVLTLARSVLPGEARAFFETHFSPWRILPADDKPALLTGYYEPEVDGSLEQGPDFTTAVLARPDDLVTFDQGLFPIGAGLTAGRRDPDGSLHPYPERTAIEQGAIAARTKPVVWLRDAVEAFLIHVQGSARVRLPDGRVLRLTYDGRNGHPYRSIGRMLIDSGDIAEAEMSLARLKAFLRADRMRGRAIMAHNPSFIFFKGNAGLAPDAGPVGGAGVSLTPLRSIAVDRGLWPYGLPFFIEADLPWRRASSEPFARLMIAQDTGSAILGPARADLFFGAGPEAGERAGDIRHAARFFVLLPAGVKPA